MRKYCFILILVSVIGLAFSGCLKVYLVTKDRYPDEFVVHNISPRGPMTGDEKKLKLFIYPQVVTQPEKEPVFDLIVMQKTRYDDLILKTLKGKSLVLSIDNERYEFETEERLYGETGIVSSEFPLWRHRKTDISCTLVEKASFGTNFKTMEKIANAERVEVTLIGEGNRAVKKQFAQQHFEIFQSFAKFVNKKL